MSGRKSSKITHKKFGLFDVARVAMVRHSSDEKATPIMVVERSHGFTQLQGPKAGI